MPWYQTSVATFISGVAIPKGGVFLGPAGLSGPTLTAVAGPAAALLTTTTLFNGVEVETFADGSIAYIPPAGGTGIAAGTALDLGTVGGVLLPGAFLSLQSTAAQTIVGALQVTNALDLTSTFNWSGGNNVNASNRQAGGVSGTIRVGGTVVGGATGFFGSGLNNLLVLDSLVAGDTTLATYLVAHIVDSGTGLVSGGRVLFEGSLTIEGPTGSGKGGVAAGQHTGLQAYVTGSGNDNGTASVASGTLFGSNYIVSLANGATHYNGILGNESGNTIPIGCSALANIGLHLTLGASHAVSGSQLDAAISIDSGGALGWVYGLLLNSNVKPSGFSSVSTLIGSQAPAGGGAVTVVSGIDLRTGFTFTGVALAVPGLTVPGQGLGVTQITNGLSVAGTLALPSLPATTKYANDAAAKAGGVPIGGIYANSNVAGCTLLAIVAA